MARTTKTKTLASVRLANDRGRTLTGWLISHGHRTTCNARERAFVPTTDADRRQALEQARAWAQAYSSAAQRAQYDVEAWAIQELAKLDAKGAE